MSILPWLSQKQTSLLKLTRKKSETRETHMLQHDTITSTVLSYLDLARDRASLAQVRKKTHIHFLAQEKPTTDSMLYCIKKNYGKSLCFLLDQFHLNPADQDYYLLMEACIHDGPEMLHILLSHIKEPIPTVYSNMILSMCCQEGRWYCLCVALSMLPQVAITIEAIFAKACEYNKINIAQYLLQEHPIIIKNMAKDELLLKACKDGHESLVSFLLQFDNWSTAIYSGRILEKAMRHIVIFKMLLQDGRFVPQNQMEYDGLVQSGIYCHYFDSFVVLLQECKSYKPNNTHIDMMFDQACIGNRGELLLDCLLSKYSI
jgi:hypothetical protein